MMRLVALTVIFLTVNLSAQLIPSSMPNVNLESRGTLSSFSSLPLSFTENRGQWNDEALFKAEAGGATFWFCQDEVAYVFTRDTDELIDNGVPQGFDMPGLPDKFDRPRHKRESLVIRPQFIGANPEAETVGKDRLSHNNNYFLGNDPSKWATDVPNFSSITYKDIYPGIDLKYHGNGQGMKYDCSGYFSKGKSVCPRSVIPMDELEGFVMETIGKMLAEYFTGDNLQALRKLVAEEVNSLAPDFGDEIDGVENRLSEIDKIITNLIDNITATNREFVDKRIIELKREKAELENRLQTLEAEGKKRIETETIIEQALSMAGDYQGVFAEGTIEEKRFFIRAFLSRIELDPESRQGEARFILLPGMQNALPKSATMTDSEGNPNEKGPNGPDMSSLILVAGGRFEEEKMTCNRLNLLLKSPSIGNRPPLRNWNLIPIITLWELPLNNWKLRTKRFGPPKPVIPDNLQN